MAQSETITDDIWITTTCQCIKN